ncbi:MAG: hypothetical protein QM820_23405 [Minicystis sp.]
MRRSFPACLALALAGCATTITPPPAPRPDPVSSAPLLAPSDPVPVPFLVVPAAEATPRVRLEEKQPESPRFRAEGKRHAIERTSDGVVVLSADRGILGFVAGPPEAIRAASFVEDDAVLVLGREGLRRAASPDDAVAGKLAPVGGKPGLDPAVTRLASAGKVVVAVSDAPDAPLLLSRDAGRTFAPWKRPAAGPLTDLAVRSDGVVVVLIEREKRPHDGVTEIHADTWSARAGGAWEKGPSAAALWGGSPLASHGDALVVQVLQPGRTDDTETRGLDARGKWIAAGYPKPWLEHAWTGDRFGISPPEPRPGFPGADLSDGAGGLGLLGGLASQASGVWCLRSRAFAGTPPRVRAFQDGVCAPEHVVQKTETYHVVGTGREPEHDEQHTFPICDPKAPAQRTSTLLVRAEGAASRFVRLPASCAAGSITGTDRAAYVHCDGTHRGRDGLYRVGPDGALADVAAPIGSDVGFRGAESASDGTTALVSAKATWICRPDGRACPIAGGEEVLAARPLPGGRALIARRGADDHQLELEVFGQTGAQVVRVSVPGNLLEIEVTAAGHVRLWTHPTRAWLQRGDHARGLAASGCSALLVRVDGSVVPDPDPR